MSLSFLVKHGEDEDGGSDDKRGSDGEQEIFANMMLGIDTSPALVSKRKRAPSVRTTFQSTPSCNTNFLNGRGLHSLHLTFDVAP